MFDVTWFSTLCLLTFTILHIGLVLVCFFEVQHMCAIFFINIYYFHKLFSASLRFAFQRFNRICFKLP